MSGWQAGSPPKRPTQLEQVVCGTPDVDANPNALSSRDFPSCSDHGKGTMLSEQVWEVATGGRSKRRNWRERHLIDEDMRARFSDAAGRVEVRNAILHRGSYRLNAMLTLNIGMAVDHMNMPAKAIQARMFQNLRNIFRGRSHCFAGLWRRETFGGAAMGEHLHVLTHLPRGMRARLVDRLPVWTCDPLDTRRTSKRFDRRCWHAVGTLKTWHLCRVHSVDGALDYLSKIPLGVDDTPVSRQHRLGPGHHGAHEFGVFGLVRSAE